MRTEELEHLMTTGTSEGKPSRGKQQQEKMLDELTKWLNVGRVTDTLKVHRD